MIKKIKEDMTIYIKKCKHCKSDFQYTADELIGYEGKRQHTLRCPYCNFYNKIYSRKIYKTCEEMEEDTINKLAKDVAYYKSLYSKEYENTKYLEMKYEGLKKETSREIQEKDEEIEHLNKQLVQVRNEIEHLKEKIKKKKEKVKEDE